MNGMSMKLTQTARRVHLVVAWLFVSCVLVQTFLIGLVLFADGEIQAHRLFGLVTLLVSLLVPVTAAIARLPSSAIRLAAGLFGATLLQASLAGMKWWSGPEMIAALHPVGALVLFLFGVVVARRARSFVVLGVQEITQTRGAARGPSTPPA